MFTAVTFDKGNFGAQLKRGNWKWSHVVPFNLLRNNWPLLTFRIGTKGFGILWLGWQRPSDPIISSSVANTQNHDKTFTSKSEVHVCDACWSLFLRLCTAIESVQVKSGPVYFVFFFEHYVSLYIYIITNLFLLSTLPLWLAKFSYPSLMIVYKSFSLFYTCLLGDLLSHTEILCNLLLCFLSFQSARVVSFRTYEGLLIQYHFLHVCFLSAF